MEGGSGRSFEKDSELTLLSREELESVIHERTEALENVMDAMVDVLVKLDSDGQIQLANAAVTSILGHDREAVVGKPVDVLLAPPEAIEEGFDLVTSDEFLARLIREGQVTDLEVGFSTQEGETIPMSLSTAVIEDEDGGTEFVCVAKDISERKAAEQELRDRKLQLALLNQMLQHDLRNDMMVLLSYARRLEDHLDDSGKAHLENVLDRGESVIDLTESVETLIDAIERDDSQDLVPVELRPVLQREFEESVEKYPDADFRPDGEWPNVVVQANGMLQSVLRNLLTNAVKHNDKADPEVGVAVTADDERVQIQIADNGPGVPDERKEKIFGKGEQGLANSTSGIGLYLVHTIVTQYGGDVWVEDNDPDGSVFILELPRSS